MVFLFILGLLTVICALYLTNIPNRFRWWRKFRGGTWYKVGYFNWRIDNSTYWVRRKPNEKEIIVKQKEVWSE